jgi:hypothetical protein
MLTAFFAGAITCLKGLRFETHSIFAFMFAFIAFLIGLNLRPILASIGPLFPVLQREAGYPPRNSVCSPPCLSP